MPHEKRDLTGVLFMQEEKENPKWADFKGSCLINGQEYWLDGWKKSSNGKKFISLSIKPKQPKEGGGGEW